MWLRSHVLQTVGIHITPSSPAASVEVDTDSKLFVTLLV